MTLRLREGGPGLALEVLDSRTADPIVRERWRTIIAHRSAALQASLGLRVHPLQLEEDTDGPVLRVHGIAGTLRLGTVELDVAPKHQEDLTDDRWRAALLAMIERAERRRASHHVSERLQLGGVTFADHVAFTYAIALEQALRKAPIRMYESRQEHTPVLRGRLLVSEQLRSSLTTPHLLVCEVDRLNDDNPINRLLQWAGQRLLSLATNGAVRRSLSHHLSRIPGVTTARVPILRRGALPRQFAHYGQAVEIASAVARATGAALGGAHRRAGGGFAIGTEKLFELVVQHSLAIAAHDRPWTVSPQVSGPFADPVAPNPGARFNSKPDNLVQAAGCRLVVDAKYKRFEDATEASRGSRPTNADLYQMAAAAIAHRCDRALLVYPKMAATDTAAETEIRWWSIKGWTTDTLRVGVCSVDLQAIGGPGGIGTLDRRLAALVDEAIA